MPNTMPTGASHQSRAIILIAGLFSFASVLITPAPLPVAASGICLALIVGLLWTRDEPPILLLPALFQWSEVATVPLSTIWKQVPLNELSEHNADLDSAALYGLLAVGVLAVALRLGSGRSQQPVFASRLRAEAMVWSYRDVAVV